jgi:hypothetical protein
MARAHGCAPATKQMTVFNHGEQKQSFGELCGHNIACSAVIRDTAGRAHPESDAKIAKRKNSLKNQEAFQPQISQMTAEGGERICENQCNLRMVGFHFSVGFREHG